MSKPLWTQKEDIGPTARMNAGMAYDVIRRRAVLFGGQAAPGLLNDTWVWNGELWRHLETLGVGTAQNGRRNKTQGQAPERTINWRTMRFATAPFSLAVQPFKAIRWTREAFGPVITTKLTILIIFSMTRGNGTARNGAGSPTPDRHHAADTEWDSTDPSVTLRRPGIRIF